jgi:hypothetical protein
MVFIERGHKIAFHDIHVNPRVGTSKVRIRDGFSTMVLVMRFVMLFAPMRLLFVPGMLALLAGVAYGVARALTTGRGLPVAAALIAITGLFMAMLGLVADQISQLRFAQLGIESALRDDVFKDPDVFEVRASEGTESPLLRDADQAPPERRNDGNSREGSVEVDQQRS